jgi:hypothetical protein
MLASMVLVPDPSVMRSDMGLPPLHQAVQGIEHLLAAPASCPARSTQLVLNQGKYFLVQGYTEHLHAGFELVMTAELLRLPVRRAKLSFATGRHGGGPVLGGVDLLGALVTMPWFLEAAIAVATAPSPATVWEATIVVGSPRMPLATDMVKAAEDPTGVLLKKSLPTTAAPL